MSKLSYAFYLFFMINLVKSSSLNVREEPIETLIQSLSEKISKFQALKPVDFKPTLPLPTWAEKVGLYRSDIRLNFAGNPVLKELRSGSVVYVYDNDMFSTGWIVTCLLEASLYGKGAPDLDSDRLQLALEAIGSFNNKNDENASKSLTRTFWPQFFNKTNGNWFQQPINIEHVAEVLKIFDDAIPFKQFEEILKSLGLNKLAKLVEQIASAADIDTLLDAFHIPPDFDDTYLNLGLGATLNKLNNKYPLAYKSWLFNNSDFEHLINVTSKYAYRPFDDDLNKNTIDPRTYYYARKFIQDAYINNEPISIITTWVQNIEEQRGLKRDKVSMPFNVNNVDVTVAANAIYGISSASIQNINNFGTLFLQSSDMQQIYLNTTKFIAHAINTNFSGRPDLAQVYYPSRYNFLWYTSRTLFLLDTEFEKYDQMTKLNDPKNKEYLKHFRALEDIFNEARSYLNETFQNTVTQYLLANRKDGETENETYFCDFLGADDTNILGQKKPSNDDCLFSTAQAVNILLATWTTHSKVSNKLVWKANVSQQVTEMLDHSVNWLKRNALGDKFKPMNVFFSGSVKTFNTLPFLFPTTITQYLNGTNASPNDIPNSDFEKIILGVEGSIEEKTYQELLRENHFNLGPTQIDFNGYNSGAFPFWSSEPYTHAVTLLALSQYNNL